MSTFCEVNEIGTYPYLKFVVILSRYGGKILLSRHKERSTWETQGGHIEPGETPLEAARRELYEESGAAEYEIRELFEYRAGDNFGESAGAVFFAEITELGPLPKSEMAETKAFDTLPENITYPAISPCLFHRARALFPGAVGL